MVMSGIRYYVVDTETTGVSTKTHEVVELSIIKVGIDGEKNTQFYKKIIAEHPETASLDALRITRKTMADLRQGERAKDVVDMVDRFLEQDGLTPAHRCIVAHNAPFDRRFIHTLWEKQEKKFLADLWLDTIPMFKSYAKRENIKTAARLDVACEVMGIVNKSGAAHNASSDSRNTYYLLKKMIDSNVPYLSIIKNEPHIIKNSRLSQDEVESLLSSIPEGFGEDNDTNEEY